jgi:hypothetical protein
MRTQILRTDAIFLGLAGVFGVVSDLLSWKLGSGPFGRMFYGNPTVIGVVEAHGLALLIATTLWHLAPREVTTFGNWIALLTHGLLGVSNIIWFDVFTLVRAETNGIAVTIVHFAFVLLNAHVIFRHGKLWRSRNSLADGSESVPR